MRSSEQRDHAQIRAACFALATMRRERLVTARADVECLEGGRGETGASELGARCSMEVESTLLKKIRGVGERGLELGANLRSDFVTVGADRWSNGGAHPRWLRAPSDHRFDRPGEDARTQAAPARVHRRDDTGFDVCQEHGDAVGGRDSDGNPGPVDDEGITVASRRCGERSIDVHDVFAVNLLQACNVRVSQADGSLKRGVIGVVDESAGETVGDTLDAECRGEEWLTRRLLVGGRSCRGAHHGEYALATPAGARALPMIRLAALPRLNG